MLVKRRLRINAIPSFFEGAKQRKNPPKRQGKEGAKGGYPKRYPEGLEKRLFILGGKLERGGEGESEVAEQHSNAFSYHEKFSLIL